MKSLLREAIPKSAQVPIKFWMDRARGYLEPEMELLAYLVKSGDHVIDVGGNRGVYAYQLWKLGASVDVFEPNPVCLAVLGPWAHGRPRVTLHEVGLSDHPGVAELHIPIDGEGVEHDASASLEKHDFGNQRSQAITLATLDSFQFDDVSFIKVDVEGHESRVVDGASATLAACRPALLVEIEQRHCVEKLESVFGRILAHGYEGFFLEGRGLKSIASFDVATHQAPGKLGHRDGSYINNFLFLPGSALAMGEYAGLEALGLTR